MKILHVAESIRGGCGTYLNQILPLQIGDLGVENVRVVVPDAHIEQIPAVPVAQISTFKRDRRSLRSLMALAAEATHQIDTFKPDIVHLHSTFAGGVVRLTQGWRPGRPAIVYCPHGWVFDTVRGGFKRRVLELAERILTPLCDRVIAISNYEAREGRRVGTGSKTRLVLNGIARVAPAPKGIEWLDGRLRVLFIGRLDRQKGFDILAEAVAALSASVAVRVAGEAVVGTIGSYTWPENVEFLGWLDEAEMQGHLNGADILVVPSRWEGFGLVVLEAMRVGKPVIASRVGGVPEIIVDGETGYLLPKEDVGALRSLLMDITGMDRENLQNMGLKGRDRFLELFTIDRTHAGLNEVYAELNLIRTRSPK